MIGLAINAIFQILYILVLARVILSWVRVSPYDPTWGPLVSFIHQTTEPIMAPIRNIMPPMGGLDLSPIIVFFGLRVLQGLLLSIF